MENLEKSENLKTDFQMFPWDYNWRPQYMLLQGSFTEIMILLFII